MFRDIRMLSPSAKTLVDLGTCVVNRFHGDGQRNNLRTVSFIIGIGRFVFTYGYSTLFTIAAYRITRNTRHLYLKAGLSQEIAFFDGGTGGLIAMQATSNGRLIQAGVSEKLGLVIQEFLLLYRLLCWHLSRNGS